MHDDKSPTQNKVVAATKKKQKMRFEQYGKYGTNEENNIYTRTHAHKKRSPNERKRKSLSSVLI